MILSRNVRCTVFLNSYAGSPVEDGMEGRQVEGMETS